jgi:hypothetical protein
MLYGCRWGVLWEMDAGWTDWAQQNIRTEIVQAPMNVGRGQVVLVSALVASMRTANMRPVTMYGVPDGRVDAAVSSTVDPSAKAGASSALFGASKYAAIGGSDTFSGWSDPVVEVAHIGMRAQAFGVRVVDDTSGPIEFCGFEIEGMPGGRRK